MDTPEIQYIVPDKLTKLTGDFAQDPVTGMRYPPKVWRKACPDAITAFESPEVKTIYELMFAKQGLTIPVRYYDFIETISLHHLDRSLPSPTLEQMKLLLAVSMQEALDHFVANDPIIPLEDVNNKE